MNGLLKKIITILLVITMLAAVSAASACKGKSNTGSVTEPEKPEPGKPDPDEPEKPDPENPDPDKPEPGEEPKFSDNTYTITLSDNVACRRNRRRGVRYNIGESQYVARYASHAYDNAERVCVFA